jgi:hypothetical protein
MNIFRKRLPKKHVSYLPFGCQAQNSFACLDFGLVQRVRSRSALEISAPRERLGESSARIADVT